MTSFIHRYWNWCKRFRYRCGYGVHSPSDFFLITSVIYEKLPFYAYSELAKKDFPPSRPHYRTKVNQLLFRLVNHLAPRSLVEIGTGNGASINYMRAARSSMESYIVEDKSLEDTMKQLERCIRTMKGIDFLHIGHTRFYKEALETAMPHVSRRTCCVIGNPYQTPEKEAWWKQVQDDARVALTFDLYDIGLVFFDITRFKQNYIVNFL